MVYPVDWNMASMNMPGTGMVPPTGDAGTALAMQEQMPAQQPNWWDKFKGGAGDILGDPGNAAMMSQMLLKIMGDPQKTADLVGGMGQSYKAAKAYKGQEPDEEMTPADLEGLTSRTIKAAPGGGSVETTTRTLPRKGGGEGQPQGAQPENKLPGEVLTSPFLRP